MHEIHHGIAKRLRRAKGHLDHVVEMLEEGRSCLELAQQIQAVEKAISSAKKVLIHDHLEHCIADSLDGKGKSGQLASELRSITKYL